DRVLTSGGDQIFPKGLIVGTVDKIEKGPEFLQITVKPAAALNRLEEVLIIVKKEERDPTLTSTHVRASDILAERLPSVPDKPPVPTSAGGATTQTHAPQTPHVAHVQPVTASSGIPGQMKSVAVPVPGIAQPASTPVPNATGTAVGTKPANSSSVQASKPAVKQSGTATSKPLQASPAAQPQPSTQPTPSNSGDTPQ
ncbi:MAG TPA: rod shape-determining protein MreC, partial [Terriglobales bacterium]|nr:rod shape-determining protein MreC [Terriglobales bacterium]